MSATSPDVEAVRTWLAARRTELIEQLSAWVRIPSVAGVPERADELRRSAEWLAERMRAAGVPAVEIWQPSDGPPALFAEWHGPANAPTVLVYSHHDVRATKDEEWTCCPPFAPIVRGDRLFGRGASDAKGQALAHLWGLQGYLATTGAEGPPVNLKYLIEGEEETGSPHLAEMLRRHAGRLCADLVVFSDTMTWSRERPALCTGVRGMMKAHLEIRGAAGDVHAGAVSGAAVNPADEMVRVLAELHRADGTIAIPGFYDDVEQPSSAEREQLAELTADEADWRRRSAVDGCRCEPGRSLGEQLYTRPAAEVLMLSAGDAKVPTTGTMPAVATADIQFSLVPWQRPRVVDTQLRRWVAERLGSRVEYTLSIEDPISQPPYRTPEHHPALGALSDAMTQAWQRRVARMRNAGSGPSRLLSDATGAPVVFFGTGLPEDRWHANDESVDLDVLLTGAATVALLWPRLREQLARCEPSARPPGG